LIPPETIALVRDRTNIVTLVQEAVPSLKKRGRSWVGLCPFHREKTPSFHVNPERGFFHCFGCKESGSAIDFVMKQDGYTFPEAVRMLAERCGVVVEEETRPAAEVDRQKKAKDDLYAALSVAAGFFEKMLREHPDRGYALEELEKRGVLPSWASEGNPPRAQIDDTLQAFRIGYAPNEWDALARYLRDQGISPQTAETVGLLAPRSAGSGHYDRFRHRLMFAVTDTQGRPVAFSGRALRTPATGPLAGPGDAPPKYINSPESPVYTKGQLLFGLFQARHAIRQEEKAILVEGNFDVVTLHARGVANVVAPLGTAFTEEQAKLLRRYAGEVVLCFDGDAAGRKATRLSREPCRVAGLTVRVARLPDGTDPDQLVRDKGPEAIGELVGAAQGLLEFLIEDALDHSFASADAYERAARVKEVVRLIAEEDDPLVHNMAKRYADRLAGRLDLVGRDEHRRGDTSPETFRALEHAVKKALAEAQARDAQRARQRPSREAVTPDRARVPARPVGSAERGEIVGAFIDFPSLLFDPELEWALDLLTEAAALTIRAIRQSIKTSEDGEKTLDTSAFLAQMPPAIQSFAVRRLAAPQLETLQAAKDAVLSNATKLKRMLLEKESRELGARGGAWSDEDDEALKALSDLARQERGIKGGTNER
jgi:DNA primase